MGNCCTPHTHYLDAPQYMQQISLKINNHSPSTSNPLTTFSLAPPADQNNSIISLLNLRLRVSGCVLPGIDPHNQFPKDCQDSFSFASRTNILIALLFDGHGKCGKYVSFFCRDFMLNFFHKNHLDFEKNCKTALETMFENCNNELVLSKVGSHLSGTTALAVVVNSLGIHTGSVGDSRAVLATLPISNECILRNYQPEAFRRPVMPIRNLDSVALTIDQKPNHEEELQRIKDSGGMVERLLNEMGEPVGPYRVWQPNGSVPGLAMSRSMGDNLAHDIGVSSKPICHSFKLYSSLDQFIILGSDGVWDVMDNYEAVYFVDKFRNSCQNAGNLYPARCSNSSIARLLCEESRYRWLGVVQQEDVMIDDISCVVIEFYFADSKEEEERVVEERTVNKFKSLVIENIRGLESGEAVRNDFVRGSVAKDKEDIKSALLEVRGESVNDKDSFAEGIGKLG